MSTELVKAEKGGAVAPYSQEQMAIVKGSICQDHNDAEVAFFLEYCRVKSIDPFSKMIYSVIRTNNRGKRTQTFQIGIDGMRAKAESSGKYRGQVGPFWCGEDGKWTDIWLSKNPPLAAKVGIRRSDFDEPMWGIAKWAEYKPSEDWMWGKMPSTMLAKCAESLALRKAFPDQLGGIYSDEEMAQQPAERVLHGKEYREDAPPDHGGCSLCDRPAVVSDDLGRYCAKHKPKDVAPDTGAGLAPGEITGPEYAFLDEIAPQVDSAPAQAISQSSPLAPVLQAGPKEEKGGGSRQPAPEQNSGGETLRAESQPQGHSSDVPDRGGAHSPAPAPETKKRLTKGKTNEEIAADMGLFMKAAKVWKWRLFDWGKDNEAYYAVLASVGVDHANQLRGQADRLKALLGWSVAHNLASAGSASQTTEAESANGAGALPERLPERNQEPVPPTIIPPASPEASPIPSAEPPARQWDPGWEKFSSDMGQVLSRAPAEFMRTLAKWGYPSIANIPVNERQGRLDAMRVACR